MRLRSSRWLWALPLTLLGGCLLPSFENVAGTPDVGEGGSGGSGGTPPVDGGAAGESTWSGAPNAGAGGEEPRPSEPEVLPDVFVLEQGKSLKLNARSGVLSNDSPAGLRVASVDDADASRPAAYDAELEIAEDGSVTFTPVPEFFGRYVARYTVLAPSGAAVDTTVTFVVQPTAADLSVLEDGVGGVVLSGSAGDGAGAALAALGDVNADGFDDFAIGAPGGSDGHGSVYVVLGGPSFGALTLASAASAGKFAVLSGSDAVPIGSYVASAGTFNDDAVPDVLVGAPNADSNVGRLFVAYGGQNLGPELALDGLDAASGIALSGAVVGGRLGERVAGGEDFDGDQKPDIVAGYRANSKGGVCIVLGKPASSSDIDAVDAPVLNDSGAYDLPKSLAFVGDVNDDGRDDVLASSTLHVALLFGQATAADVPAAVTDLPSKPTGLLRRRDDSASAVVASVAGSGDLNGDGKSDFTYCDQFAAGKTSCYSFFGPLPAGATLETPDWRVVDFAGAPPLVAAGRDLNQDDLSDLLFADEASAYVVFGRDAGFGDVKVDDLGDAGFSLAAPAGGAISAVASIGDVNGDGYGDFAVGDSAAAGGAGRVYVVLGGPYAAAQR